MAKTLTTEDLRKTCAMLSAIDRKDAVPNTQKLRCLTCDTQFRMRDGKVSVIINRCTQDYSPEPKS